MKLLFKASTAQVERAHVRFPVLNGILALLCPVDIAVSLVSLVVHKPLLPFGHQAGVASLPAKIRQSKIIKQRVGDHVQVNSIR